MNTTAVSNCHPHNCTILLHYNHIHNHIKKTKNGNIFQPYRSSLGLQMFQKHNLDLENVRTCLSNYHAMDIPIMFGYMK